MKPQQDRRNDSAHDEPVWQFDLTTVLVVLLAAVLLLLITFEIWIPHH